MYKHVLWKQKDFLGKHPFVHMLEVVRKNLIETFQISERYWNLWLEFKGYCINSYLWEADSCPHVFEFNEMPLSTVSDGEILISSEYVFIRFRVLSYEFDLKRSKELVGLYMGEV